MAPSRLLIALLATTLGLCLAPASAVATHNDDFQDATEITEDELFNDYFDDNDNTNATEQPPNEVLDCEGNEFGKTLWWTFTAPVDGFVDITASGIDTVVWVVPFEGGVLFYGDEDAECSDVVGAGSENVAEYVFGGVQYYIQVGGFDDGTGAEEGNVDLAVRFFADSDGDRVADILDDCPNEPGVDSEALDGCPDGDGDGIRNSQDSCPAVSGLASFAGCPDADGDGVPEPPDACPGQKGDLANGCPSPPPPPPPCPPPDVDGDGICDRSEPAGCVGENSSGLDANRNGCRDLQRFDPRWIFTPDSFFTRRGGRVVYLGLEIDRIGVRNLPQGARVVVTCTRRACRRTSKRARRANRPVLFGQLAGDDFRAGVKVTIRVMAPGYVGAARVFTIRRNKYSRETRCFMPGTSRLRTNCSSVR